MQNETKKLIVTGKLIKFRREAKTFKGKKSEPKLYITLSDVKLSDDDLKMCKEAFKTSGEKFTPDWVKDFKGYVNTSTTFELPCKDYKGVESDVEKYAEGNDLYNAICRLQLVIKEGAIYPKALMIDTAGEPYNAFADFE